MGLVITKKLTEENKTKVYIDMEKSSAISKELFWNFYKTGDNKKKLHELGIIVTKYLGNWDVCAYCQNEAHASIILHCIKTIGELYDNCNRQSDEVLLQTVTRLNTFKNSNI